MGHSEYDLGFRDRKPWNAGRKLGAKRALKPQQVWAIRFPLDRERRVRHRAMFDLAIDSKLRGCDIVKIRVGDLVRGGQVRSRAIIVPGGLRDALSPADQGVHHLQADRKSPRCSDPARAHED